MKKWILIFILPSFLILIQYVYLIRVFEIKKIEDIVNRQITNRSIYGAAFNSNVFKYKLLLIEKNKPEIIALGSSTVMTLEQKIFSKKFINAGGAMNSLDEGILFINELKKFTNRPKLLIINLDFWWFNIKYNKYNFKNFDYHTNKGNNLNLDTLYNFNKSLFSAQIPFETVKYFFQNKYMNSKFSNEDSLGLSALIKGAGYRHDGSYNYGGLLYGDEVSDDEQFLQTKNRINNENARFQTGEFLDEEQLRKLEILINKIEEMKIDYIILMPPLANSVFTIIDKNPKYLFVEKIFQHLEINYKEKFSNFFNPLNSETNNCEFIDGFHAGSNTFAKIFNNMTNKSLKNFVLEKKELDLLITKNEGKAQFIINEKQTLPEVDFLKLGCKKD